MQVDEAQRGGVGEVQGEGGRGAGIKARRAVGCGLLAVGCGLLAVGCWLGLLAVGCGLWARPCLPLYCCININR